MLFTRRTTHGNAIVHITLGVLMCGGGRCRCCIFISYFEKHERPPATCNLHGCTCKRNRRKWVSCCRCAWALFPRRERKKRRTTLLYIIAAAAMPWSWSVGGLFVLRGLFVDFMWTLRELLPGLYVYFLRTARDRFEINIILTCVRKYIVAGPGSCWARRWTVNSLTIKYGGKANHYE